MKPFFAKSLAALILAGCFFSLICVSNPAKAVTNSSNPGIEIKLPPNMPVRVEFLGFLNGQDVRLKVTNLIDRPIMKLNFRGFTFSAIEDVQPSLQVDWSLSNQGNALQSPIIPPLGAITGTLSIPTIAGTFKRGIFAIDQVATNQEVWNLVIDDSTIGVFDLPAATYDDNLSTAPGSITCNDYADAISRACKKHFGGGVALFRCEEIPGGHWVTWRCVGQK